MPKRERPLRAHQRRSNARLQQRLQDLHQNAPPQLQNILQSSLQHHLEPDPELQHAGAAEDAPTRLDTKNCRRKDSRKQEQEQEQEQKPIEPETTMNRIRFEFVKPAHGRLTYSPGDVVAGNCIVELSGNTAAQTSRVDIVFSGRSEIRLFEKKLNNANMRLGYPGNTQKLLFEERRLLGGWDWPSIPGTGVQVWPFHFIVPRLQDGTNPPPSMNHMGQGGVFSGTTRVVYQLEGQVFSVDGHCLRKESSDVELSPLCWYPLPGLGLQKISKKLEVESHYLDNSYARSDGMSRAFSRMALHKALVAQFEVAVELPQHAVVGEGLTFVVGVNWERELSTAKDRPEVKMTALKVQYRENMEVGALTTRSEDPYIKFQPNLVNSPILLTERLDVRSALPPTTFLLSRGSFRSPEMRRYYDDLTVEMTIECARKTFQMSFSGAGELTIHPLRPVQSAQEVPGGAVTSFTPELMGSTGFNSRVFSPPEKIAELPLTMPANGIGMRNMAELP